MLNVHNTYIHTYVNVMANIYIAWLTVKFEQLTCQTVKGMTKTKTVGLLSNTNY